MEFATTMVLGVLATVGPTPLERSRANYEAIRAVVHFRFAQGQSVGGGVEAPGTGVLGTWSCNGQTEHLRWRPESGRPGTSTDEVLWDGATLVSRRPRSLEVAKGEGVGPPRDARSPLWWGLGTSFPHIIDSAFQGVEPKRFHGARDGRPVEVEVYRKKSEQGWTQIEVVYDPSIGWLPKEFRMIEFDCGAGRAIGLAMQVEQARQCAQGGFVPTEWSCETWELSGLGTSPSESPETVPTGHRRGTIVHFHAFLFYNLQASVAIIASGVVDRIEGPGGSEPLAPDAPLITMEMAHRILGEKAKAPAPPAPRAESPESDVSSVLLALATTGVLTRAVAKTLTRWLR